MLNTIIRLTDDSGEITYYFPVEPSKALGIIYKPYELRGDKWHARRQTGIFQEPEARGYGFTGKYEYFDMRDGVEPEEQIAAIESRKK